jgi:hypothetical protein
MAERPKREGLAETESLERRQADAFRTGRPAITRPREAERFLREVGVALRYGRTAGLPLASLYEVLGARADRDAHRRAIALTNRLLGEGHAIEVHVIAARVTVVHRSMVPSLYALVRRGQPVDDEAGLGANARTALSLLRQRGQATAGDVRRRLGLRLEVHDDPAYAALGELLRRFLVDRGPFEVPAAGIPYLSTEGYPYHLFHAAHPQLVAASRRLSVGDAAESFLGGYIRGALFARVQKLGTLFKAFLTPAEIDTALLGLSKRGVVRLAGTGRNALAISTA